MKKVIGLILYLGPTISAILMLFQSSHVQVKRVQILKKNLCIQSSQFIVSVGCLFIHGRYIPEINTSKKIPILHRDKAGRKVTHFSNLQHICTQTSTLVKKGKIHNPLRTLQTLRAIETATFFPYATSAIDDNTSKGIFRLSKHSQFHYFLKIYEITQ